MDMTTRQRSHQFYIASIPSIPFNTNPPQIRKHETFKTFQTFQSQEHSSRYSTFEIFFLYSSWECDPIPDSTAFMMSIASTWRVVTAHVQSQCSLCFCHCLLEGAFFCSPWCLSKAGTWWHLPSPSLFISHIRTSNKQLCHVRTWSHLHWIYAFNTFKILVVSGSITNVVTA